MLVELAISDFAIIEQLHLSFDAGFSVLTGETGAGKSIIIDAVNLLLGERASTDLIRTGCESACVEGIFALSEEVHQRLDPLLEEQGLVAEDDTLILRREISHARRNISRINGLAVTLSTLQAIGRHLVDIHGQGDHLSLLQERHHIDFLDRYGGLYAQREAVASIVRELRAVAKQYSELQRNERETARRVDLLTFQVEEIRSANLQPGEEVDLRQERLLLANAEKRMQLAASGYDLLTQGEDEQRSVTDLLNELVETMDELAGIDPSLADTSQRVQGALDQMEDLARTMRHYRDEVEFDPQGLVAVEERLQLIISLKRKYGDTIEDVLAFAGRAQAELDQISHSEERMAELRKTQDHLLAELAQAGVTLSDARHKVATTLEQSIESQLADLSMEQARFKVDVRRGLDKAGVLVDGQRYHYDATGLDQVEFLIAPNLGEDPKPLSRIASGGETSRLMLAMKTALSTVDPVPTLIFDEVDAGIGGRTGSIVGHKLWTLAQHHQVFCITHLAQIAAYGNVHHNVAKAVVEGRTVSQVTSLTPDQRVDEIAVMLGGAITATSRSNAQELLARSSG